MSERHIINGLTDSEVLDSRRENGWNILTPAKKTPLWRLYIEKYEDPIIQILLVAAVISLVLAVINGHYVETIGIFAAIFLATTVGFLFEMDAARKFDVLTQLNEDQKLKVIRNGHVTLVARKDIVVGDAVIVETGDEIPADGMLQEAVSLQVDESMLTGEPLTTKGVSPVPSQEGVPNQEANGEAAFPRNMLLRSTMVMNGRGMFFVTAVGDSTEIGRVARASAETTEVKTPLNLQLNRLGSLINKFGFTLSIGAAVLFLGHDILVNPLWRTIGNPDADYLEMLSIVLRYFMMAVSLIVMAVPEGLPMAVTLALALNMRRMLKSNNLVRKLHACETMGAVTVICTDKTGTLTQNRMEVEEVWENTSAKAFGNLQDIVLSAIAVNSTAELDEQGNGIGNPTEVALLRWLLKNGTDYRMLRNKAEIASQEPFSTETKQMKTTVVSDGNAAGTTLTFIKGAPEIVMSQCRIDDEMRGEVIRELRRYQSKAMRTLAVAVDDTLLAVFGITDPIRPDVAGAVRQCKDAGIGVKIVTGDVDATAMEIARQIGIVSEENASGRVSISGAEFAELSDEEASKLLDSLCVMSRARPQDKQRLVQLLQRNGAVVAVTGDGTNDAPALNHAHVGLSLGSGTNVAKEASDMTLLDDSFGSIANAVMWGRSLYKNIQRFLFFQLVVNVCALLLVIAGALVGTEMPLTVTQILWVNLIMDTLAALALSSLPPSREVMKEAPRDQNDFILSRSIVRSILLTGVSMFAVMFVFLLYCEHGIDLGVHDRNAVGVDVRELTWFFTTFVMMQMWNLFNAKCIGSHHSSLHRLYADRGLLVVLVAIIVGQFVIVQFGGEMFRCVPLSLKEWIIIVLGTSPVMLIGEFVRKIKRK